MKTRSMLLVLLTTLGMLISSEIVTAQAIAQIATPDAKPWEEEWSVPLPPGTTSEDVLKSINDKWATQKNWTKLNTDRLSSSKVSIWKFTDQTGQTWIATARAESCATQRGNALVRLRIVLAAKLSASDRTKGIYLKKYRL